MLNYFCSCFFVDLKREHNAQLKLKILSRFHFLNFAPSCTFSTLCTKFKFAAILYFINKFSLTKCIGFLTTLFLCMALTLKLDIQLKGYTSPFAFVIQSLLKNVLCFKLFHQLKLKSLFSFCDVLQFLYNAVILCFFDFNDLLLCFSFFCAANIQWIYGLWGALWEKWFATKSSFQEGTVSLCCCSSEISQ